MLLIWEHPHSPLPYILILVFGDEATSHRMAWEDRVFRIKSFESAILQELAQVVTCSLEELKERLPYYSWNQVFSAVDRLTRAGTVALQRSNSSDNMLSLAPCRSAIIC